MLGVRPIPTAFRRSRTYQAKRRVASKQSPRILITGGLGQIGVELCELLRAKYGKSNVILSDIRQNISDDGPFRYVDVIDKNTLSKVVVEENISWIVHLSSILSARGEQNIKLAIDLNIRGIENVMEVARQNELRVFAPSSIAAFGPACDLNHTPDVVPMRPMTIYGVSKVYMELLGEYYNNKFGVDFRSIRYPGIISYKTPPGGGTTDYAVDVFYKALAPERKFKCFLSQDRTLPMMYMPDCLEGTIQLLEADPKLLKQRTYNIAAVSFSPKEIIAEIEKQLGYKLDVSYEPDFRDGIADSWPRSLDDTNARRDWGWNPKYGMSEMVSDMIFHLRSDKC